jgi:histidine triad (HIT) family protein
MSDCLFCKIARKEIPAEAVLETDRALAFADLNPQAPVHLLVIPKAHYENAAEASEADPELVGHLVSVAAQAARERNLSDGYRIVTNTGPDAGQSVPHLHFHLLGGRAMGWPPG